MPFQSRSSHRDGLTGSILAGFATVAFLYFAGEVLKPLALSVLLAFALVPASRLLERIGIPRSLAVVLTVLCVLGIIGVGGTFVARQLASLVAKLPDYQENIHLKVGSLVHSEASAAGERINKMVDDLSSQIKATDSDKTEEMNPVSKVLVIPDTSMVDRTRARVGPFAEVLGVFTFVLVLVLFMMVGRENLRDRIVALFGHRHVGLTTRTMEEIGGRISMYLVTVLLVNSGFALVIGVGLALIGIPYALLWGIIAGVLRFIPYVGTGVSFALPTLVAAAHFPGWGHAMAVAALFAAVETMLNSFLEPLIFGKTTGLSALGLLIAAMFWTWLWGVMGLLLSTPMTVCLAVLGKYVPNLRFFAILLGEESELEPHIRYFQRIIAMDQAGAEALVETELGSRGVIEVFDQILIPALARAGHDAERGDIDDAEKVSLYDVTTKILDKIEAHETREIAELEMGSSNGASRPSFHVVGLAEDRSDELVLRMVDLSLRKNGVSMEVPAPGSSPLDYYATIAATSPSAVVVSHLPPEEIATARYLIKRLRAQTPGVPIVLGLWSTRRLKTSLTRRLRGEGATQISVTVAEARDQILQIIQPQMVSHPEAAPLPA